MEFNFKFSNNDELESVPKDWKIGKVKDYFKIGRGRVISKDFIKENSGLFPVYSSQSINNGEMGRISTYDFEGDYLTWTTDGAYAGSVFFREGKFNCTNVCGTCLAKDSNEIHTKFFVYYLEKIAKRYVSYIGNPKLMNNVFSEIPILIPPLSEQKRITHILSVLDDYLLQLKESTEKYKILKKGVLDSFFLNPNSINELSNSKKWNISTVGKLCNLITYGFTNPMPTVTNGIPMITAKDIRDGLIDYDSARLTSVKAYKELLTKKSKPQKNDILVTKDGTLGRTAIVKDKQVCINQSVALLRPNNQRDANYLNLLLSSPFYQRRMVDQSGGSVIKHIYITTLSKMEILIPKDPEFQDHIVNTISNMNKLLNDLKRKTNHVNHLKSAISADLLSGGKRVNI